jgi:hypothetical protein
MELKILETLAFLGQNTPLREIVDPAKIPTFVMITERK